MKPPEAYGDRDFVVGSCSTNDIRLFFGDQLGDISDVDLNFVDPGCDMLDILVAAGLFKSKSQARKQGWRHRETILPGYSEFLFSKRKIWVTIFNPLADAVPRRSL